MLRSGGALLVSLLALPPSALAAAPRPTVPVPTVPGAVTTPAVVQTVTATTGIAVAGAARTPTAPRTVTARTDRVGEAPAATAAPAPTASTPAPSPRRAPVAPGSSGAPSSHLPVPVVPPKVETPPLPGLPEPPKPAPAPKVLPEPPAPGEPAASPAEPAPRGESAPLPHAVAAQPGRVRVPGTRSVSRVQGSPDPIARVATVRHRATSAAAPSRRHRASSSPAPVPAEHPRHFSLVASPAADPSGIGGGTPDIRPFGLGALAVADADTPATILLMAGGALLIALMCMDAAGIGPRHGDQRRRVGDWRPPWR